MKRFRYTPEMVEWLRTKAPGTRVHDLTEIFNREFGTVKTYQQIKSALKNFKIQTGMPGGLPKGSNLSFDAAQIEFMRRSYKVMSLSELAIAFNRAFPGAQKSENQIKSFTTNHGIHSGRSGRFEKGSVSWNKGKTGYMGANSTSFKKGHRPGNTKYEGHESLSKDGYILISIKQTNPHTGFHRRYVLKHRHVWEQLHGPVPEGKCLKFIDGNRQNCDLNNLVLIDRALLPALHWMGYEDAPAALKVVILNTAKLKHMANKKAVSV